MPASFLSPVYSADFDPRTGECVDLGQKIARVTAPNAGPYTFTGTNSYLIGENEVAVIDPGPDNERHFAALMQAIGGRKVVAVLLTHTHRDHCGLARTMMAATDAPLWSAGPHRLSRARKPFEFNAFGKAGDFSLVPDRVLADGDQVIIDGVTIEVVATPGHCANHLAFAVRAADLLLAGDHVMGWNSTMVATPDGDLADYLASLDKVIGLPQTRYLPGHGGEIADGPAFAKALKAHRLMRNGQLLDVLTKGPKSLRAATRALYPNLSGRVLLAAERTLLSHAEYLEAQGRLKIRRGLLGIGLSV